MNKYRLDAKPAEAAFRVPDDVAAARAEAMKALRSRRNRAKAELKKSMQTLLDKGKLTDAEKLHFAMAGAGTDEDAIKAVLEGKSKADIGKIAAEYKTKYKSDLTADLKS